MHVPAASMQGHVMALPAACDRRHGSVSSTSSSLGTCKHKSCPNIRCCCILSRASCIKLVQTTGCSRFRLWPSLPWRQPRWLLGTLLGPGGVQHISQDSQQLPYTPRASCGVQPTCHMGLTASSSAHCQTCQRALASHSGLCFQASCQPSRPDL